MVASPRPDPRPGPARKVLLVEPWFAGSHRAWAEGVQRHSRHDINLLASEPIGWKATFQRSAAKLAAQAGRAPDLVLASSMMDLAEFIEQAGFGPIPTLLYLHENQLTYDRSKPDLDRGDVNWRSAQAADRVAFNSRFHLEDFLAALPMLGIDDALIEMARQKSVVLPVGLDLTGLGRDLRDDGPPVVVWNHRWENDKGPDAFVETILEIAHLPFRLILTGHGAGLARLLPTLTARLGDRILHAGYAPDGEYRALLSRADVVVSTAHQEFFGVSIAEAMAAGAVPLVPNRLAYPELLGPALAACLYEPGTLAERLGLLVTKHGERDTCRPHARAAGGRFNWTEVAPSYDAVIDSMV
jgi:glycosyltransferase involved in cell wall biosynthesis